MLRKAKAREIGSAAGHPLLRHICPWKSDQTECLRHQAIQKTGSCRVGLRDGRSIYLGIATFPGCGSLIVSPGRRRRGSKCRFAAAMSRALLDDIYGFCDPFLEVCDDLDSILGENRIFKERNAGIGAITLDEAWA